MAIGFFDSGAGGLSILKHALDVNPDYDYIYFGDSANCPWGNKSFDFILNRSRKITEFLISKGSQLVVVACNSATVNAISYLRKEYSIPFVGVEPGVKPAASNSAKKKIAVLLTKAASKGNRFFDLVDKFADGVEVLTFPAPGLVEFVEEGKLDGSDVEETLRNVLQPVIDSGVDQLVLGCTHYPFLLSAIERILPESINVIDTGLAVAKRLKTDLDLKHISKGTGQITLFTSGNPDDFSKLAGKLLGIQSLKAYNQL
ncbi:MAG: glutamate racemase [Caldisericia bacterium]|nr:glutamate racemase [Caldisericia bacterium]